MIFDSGMENVKVTKSISGGLVYGDGHRRKDQTGDQKTDALEIWHLVCQDVGHANILTAFR